MSNRHFNIRIEGNVHGVFFRATAHDVAKRLSISGFVCNEADGTVYIEAEGSETEIRQFIEWCHQGPAKASVDKVMITEDVIKNFSSFEIRRT